MKTLEVLTRARDLIAKPECWTKRARSRNAAGQVARIYGGEPVSWCAAGAIHQAAKSINRAGTQDEVLALSELNRQVSGPYGLIYLNDHPMTVHSDVIGLFDRAIETLNRTGDTP